MVFDMIFDILGNFHLSIEFDTCRNNLKTSMFANLRIRTLGVIGNLVYRTFVKFWLLKLCLHILKLCHYEMCMPVFWNFENSKLRFVHFETSILWNLVCWEFWSLEFLSFERLKHFEHIWKIQGLDNHDDSFIFENLENGINIFQKSW